MLEYVGVCWSMACRWEQNGTNIWCSNRCINDLRLWSGSMWTAKQNLSTAVWRTQRHQAQKAGTIWNKWFLLTDVNSFILIFLEVPFDFERSLKTLVTLLQDDSLESPFVVWVVRDVRFVFGFFGRCSWRRRKLSGQLWSQRWLHVGSPRAGIWASGRQSFKIFQDLLKSIYFIIFHHRIWCISMYFIIFLHALL